MYTELSLKDREVTRAGYQWHAWGLIYRVSCLTGREALRSWRASKIMHQGPNQDSLKITHFPVPVVAGRKGRKVFFFLIAVTRYLSKATEGREGESWVTV